MTAAPRGWRFLAYEFIAGDLLVRIGFVPMWAAAYEDLQARTGARLHLPGRSSPERPPWGTVRRPSPAWRFDHEPAAASRQAGLGKAPTDHPGRHRAARQFEFLGGEQPDPILPEIVRQAPVASREVARGRAPGGVGQHGRGDGVIGVAPARQR